MTAYRPLVLNLIVRSSGCTLLVVGSVAPLMLRCLHIGIGMGPLALFELRHARSQAGDLVEQAVEGAGDRIGQAAGWNAIGVERWHGRLLGAAAADRPGRHANHRRAVGHLREHDGGGCDASAVADPERPQYLRAGTDDDAVAEGWVSLLAELAALRRAAAQSHAVIECAVVADLGRFADDEAHAVVDE